MTWNEMVRIEPRLIGLYYEAKGYWAQAMHDQNFCANKIWYSQGLKEELSRLVGWGAARAELATSEAYDIAYQKIYGALPDCRHEGSL